MRDEPKGPLRRSLHLPNLLRSSVRVSMALLSATAVWLSWLPSHNILSALTQFTNTCSRSESNKLTRGLIPPENYKQNKKLWLKSSTDSCSYRNKVHETKLVGRLRMVYYSVNDTGILGKTKSECSYQESNLERLLSEFPTSCPSP